MSEPIMLQRLRGCLLGQAVGDAIGLPYEGIRPRRIAKLLRGRPLRHRFLPGYGMLSDDTEHACMTVQAWLASGGDPERFARSLASRLRWWLAALPAGVGLATLRAILKLWLGFPPARAGVASAGNGPCMRAPVLGLLATGPELERLVRASTCLTHTDPRALEASLLVARASRLHSEGFDPLRALGELAAAIRGEELVAALSTIRECLEQAATPEQLAERLGMESGVSGYVNRTVPAALFCWLRFPGDFRAAIESVIRLGGDTDTTAAITGALAGAQLGAKAIPAEWLDGLCDWPRSRAWIERLAERAAEGGGVLPLFWPAVPWRNGFFLAVVLCHAARRLLPPW